MSRQHAALILVSPNGAAAPLRPLGLGQDGHGWSEAAVQALVQAHPACLPIAEIDPLFADPVPICTELNTTAGPIDNFMVTPSGLPVLVECKLWRNPEGRREVVGQILDYAKELSRWTSSDLQREVSRRLKREGNVLLELVRAAGHNVDEIGFNDAVTLNLRRGRFLLLIIGDGIREGVEAIAEYLQAHAGLHFTLGLVELPIYTMPDGGRLVAPRVVARTVNVTRTVITVPSGSTVLDAAEQDVGDEPAHGYDDVDRQAGRSRRRQERGDFWREFLDGLEVDDPEQAIPRPSGKGHISFSLPIPDKSMWLNVYRSASDGSVGISFKCSPDTLGARIMSSLVSDLDSLRDALGGELKVWNEDDRITLYDRRRFGDLKDPAVREAAFAWLGSRLNDFINTVRPRVRSAASELTGS